MYSWLLIDRKQSCSETWPSACEKSAEAAGAAEGTFPALFFASAFATPAFQVRGLFLNHPESNFGAAKSAHVCLGCLQSRSSNRKPASAAACLIVAGL